MSTSPTTFTGTKYTPYQNWLTMVVSWPSVPEGATNVTVTCVTKFWSQYAVTDVNNSFTTTVNGVTNTEGSHSINHGTGDSTTLYTKSYKIPISTTDPTSFDIYAKLSGMDYIDGDKADVSGTVTIPESGVLISHPTITAGAVDFGQNTGTTNKKTYAYNVTGGASYSITSARVAIMTTRSGSVESAHIFTVTPDAGGVALTTADIASILGYWSDLGEITRTKITFTTVADTTQTHDVYYQLNTMYDLYNLSAFNVTRGPITGTDTYPQAVTVDVNAAASSPFHQAETWPSCITAKLYRGSTELTSLTVTGSTPMKTYSKSDSTAIPIASSQDFTAKLYINSMASGKQIVYTVQVADVFMALRKGATLADNKLGINNGNPVETLDVKGSLKASGATSTGNLSVAGTAEVSGATSTGNLSVAGTAEVSGATSTGNLSVAGNIAVSGRRKTTAYFSTDGDFNSLTDEWSLIHGTATNSPRTSVTYFYVNTIFYSSSENRMQIAYSYNGSLCYGFFRHCYSSTWSPWKEITFVAT